ncbi:hypothetical protein BGX29_009657 [Mortierella sp. GBA35]|nr:hypothetical protein BGX23_004355 [Mortierella sp. AD031]KAF9094103.1 hypothetical protein BGX29_009657 [Mortierella sp. GBA35]
MGYEAGEQHQQSYQKVRLKAGELHPGLKNRVHWTEFMIPIWPDNVSPGRDVVLWEDILCFVPTAKKLLLGDLGLSFCLGQNRQELHPVRVEARPDHVMDVIG